MQIQYIIATSDVTDGGRGSNFPPGKLNVKTGPHFTYISVLSCCFFAFFGLFSNNLGFSTAIHNRIRHQFSSFFFLSVS